MKEEIVNIAIFRNSKSVHFFFFVYSEILPLVEFSPEDDIPEQEVERLLLAPPKTNIERIDPFVDTMINEEVSDILPLTLDRDALRSLDPTTILIAKWPPPLHTKYYRNLMPEWQISMCPECLQVKLDKLLDRLKMAKIRRAEISFVTKLIASISFAGISLRRL